MVTEEKADLDEDDLKRLWATEGRLMGLMTSHFGFRLKRYNFEGGLVCFMVHECYSGKIAT